MGNRLDLQLIKLAHTIQYISKLLTSAVGAKLLINKMKIHYATISETGRRRNNEDAFRIVNSEDGRPWLAMVCDGMGGHAMVEVASKTVRIV